MAAEPAHQWREKTVDYDDGPELAFTAHDGSGPPAVFIHGFLTGAVYWEQNLEALTEVCRPVVVDLWGHDRSPSPDGQQFYEPLGVIAAIDRLRVHLGHDRWLVVGHSLGAALAMWYTLANPERVPGLVVTNSNSGFADAEQDRRVAAAVRLAEHVGQMGMDAFERHPLNPKVSKRLPSRSRADLIGAFERHDPVGLSRVLRWTTPNASVFGRLDQLAVPTLLTWGVFEKRFASSAAAAKALIPNLQVAELQGGHPVNIQDPEGFETAVANFVRSLGEW